MPESAAEKRVREFLEREKAEREATEHAEARETIRKKGVEERAALERKEREGMSLRDKISDLFRRRGAIEE
jgi:hypothetical protein